MRIGLVDPQATAERQAWISGWARRSRHQILPFVLPASGPAPIAPSTFGERAERLARRLRRWLTGSGARNPAREPMGLPDLLLLTDGLDGSVFREALEDVLGDVPLWVYWHRSALAHPDPPPPEIAAVEIRTARSAHALLFYAEGQRRRFLERLRQQASEALPSVETKAHVLPPGFDPERPPAGTPILSRRLPEPLILWIDRGGPEEPDLLAAALTSLGPRPPAFRLLALNENPEAESHRAARWPLAIRERLLGILRPGDPEAAAWASGARLILETARGGPSPIALMTFAAQGPWPLVPSDSGFLDLLPEPLRPLCAYEAPEALAGHLARVLTAGPPEDPSVIRHALLPYTWPALAPRYDAMCEGAFHQRSSRAT